MNLIACVDNKWGIGRDGGLLVDYPLDRAYFQYLTNGGIVVMGRRTYESIPTGNRPLKNRTNIVISHASNFDGVINVHSMPELLGKLREFVIKDMRNDSKIWVCGGEQVYQELMDYCLFAYITKIDRDCNATVFMPNIERISRWQLSKSEKYGELEVYEFVNNIVLGYV